MALAIERPVAVEWSAEAEASLAAARRFAARAGATLVGPEHLLLGLLDPMGPALRILLANLRVDATAIAVPLRSRLALAPRARVDVEGFDDDAQGIIERAISDAQALDAPWVDSKHLLLGLLSGSDDATLDLLQGAGLTAKAVRKQLSQTGVIPSPGLRDVLTAVRPSPLFLGLAGLFAASGVGLVLATSDAAVRLLTFVFILSGWVLSVCVHEFGHALAGYLGGDRGVARRGLLTLDPRRYTDPLLSIALPLLFFMIGGIPLPGGSVWIDRRALRSERWDQAVSAAGSLGTLLCLAVVGLPFLFGLDWVVLPDAVSFWSALAGLGQLLAIVLVLNLLPIPPLDGFQLIARWLSPAWRQQAYALGWLPLFLFYLVLRQPTPLREGFWDLSYGLAELFNLPIWWGFEALELMRFG